MKVASALTSGHQAVPELAEQAVRSALDKAGLERATHIVLLLSQEFARQPQAAVRAAARAGGCLQVAGGTAAGLFTEAGWRIDQPAAAALVVNGLSDRAAEGPLISLASGNTLPYNWRQDHNRAGLLGSDAAAWSGSRPTAEGLAEFTLPGTRCRPILSTGLRPLSDAQAVETACGFDLQRVNGRLAADNLRRQLPAELRERPPLHQIAALRRDDQPAVDILSINADGSISMADEFLSGDSLTWVIRQPLSAGRQIGDLLNAAVDDGKRPDFALMFSCIGRGPLFYGGEDQDLQAFRRCLPGVPLLGAYGCGQIAPAPGGNQLFHNAALTLLFEDLHV